MSIPATVPAVPGLLQSSLLSSISWLLHGFGTRESGFWMDDLPSARVKQVHSDIVLSAHSPCGVVGEGDAIVTATPGVWVGVRTADCVPILLADRGRRGIAAVHAGWKGTAAGIVGNTIQRMRTEFGSQPADIAAVIGPAIGGCCFEVGDEVAAHFQVSGRSERGRPMVNLEAENAAQLALAGVGAIEKLGICTRCGGEAYHSYRRDGERAGRMISALCIRS